MSEKFTERLEKETSQETQNTEYNFEIMEKVEPAMVSLVEQLKDKIESGEYSALLSDEVGGRIPTLVLRKIMQEKGPESEEQLKAYFLPAGNYIRRRSEEEYKKFKEHVKKLNFGDGKILIVTEFTFSAETLNKIGSLLKGANVKNHIDAAALMAGGALTEEMENSSESFGGEIFIGEDYADESYNSVSENLDRLSGVKKSEQYSPVLKKSSENTKEVIKAREDVDLMAKRVIGQIWGN